MASILQVKVMAVASGSGCCRSPAEPEAGSSVCQCMWLPGIYFLERKTVAEKKADEQVPGCQ